MTELDPVGLLSLMVDDELEQAVMRERELMRDLDINSTISRRLSVGIELAQLVGPKDIIWKPSNNSSDCFQLEIKMNIITQLYRLADDWGYDASLVARTIILNNACKPWEVRAAEKRFPFGPLRNELGKGNIYAMKFEMPGYQIAFLKLLAGFNVRRDDVIGEALVALARQVGETGFAGSIPVSEEAIEFARRVVSTANLRQSCASQI